MLETEQRVLAAALDSEEALVEVEHHVKPSDFSSRFHQELYKTLINSYGQGKYLTYFELVKELRTDVKKTEELKNIALMVPGDLTYWINRLKDFSKKRQIKRILESSLNRLDSETADELMTDLEDRLYRLSAQDEADELLTPDDLATFTIDYVRRKYQEEKGKFDGIHLGINELARKTSGAKPGDLILLAAKTGQGKTAVALNMARRVAIVDKIPTLYLNTEMSKEQIAMRLAGMMSGINIYDIRYGNIEDEGHRHIVNQAGQIYNSKLFVYNCPNLTKAKLISTVRKYQRQQGIKLVILDYIGRMDKLHPDLKEWQVLEDMVKTCKILAQNENLAMLVLVQLNDDGTLQAAKRMKNECDLFLKFFELEEKTIATLQHKYIGQISHALAIDKNRDGEAGKMIPVYFSKENQIIVERERIEQ